MSLEGKTIIDISPLISSELAVFPGDKAFERSLNLSFDKGQHLDLSSIHTTVHLGAHTDAPNHYHAKGVGIDQRDLSLYMGECQVLAVNVAAGERIQPYDVMEKIRAKRVLFKTNSFPNPNQWNDDFCSLSPELIEKCVSVGVILLGIDTPSVDPFDDKELLSHKKIYENNMAILEGVVLADVEPGLYQLLALPLKIKDADASPVRAVLIKD